MSELENVGVYIIVFLMAILIGVGVPYLLN
jgi:hypothetical protein